jgi:archaellum component FlaC
LFAGGSFGGPRQPQQAFESQFSELQNQMGGFGEQFTGLETSLGGLGESITAITDRLDSIEQGIKGLKTNDTSQAYTRMNWQPFAEWGRRRN